MDPYVVRRIGDVTIERVQTKQSDQPSAESEAQLPTTTPVAGEGSSQPTPANTSQSQSQSSQEPPKLHQPYKMKSPGDTGSGKDRSYGGDRTTESEEEEEEEGDEDEEEDFSDEFESDENESKEVTSMYKKVKASNLAQNQYLTNVGKDWRLGSGVSIDTVTKATTSTPSKSSGSRPAAFQRSFPQQETYQDNVTAPRTLDKSVFKLGSSISLETVGHKSNEDARREFKPYRDDFVPNLNPGGSNEGASFSTFVDSGRSRTSIDERLNPQPPESSSTSMSSSTLPYQSRPEQKNTPYRVPMSTPVPNTRQDDHNSGSNNSNRPFTDVQDDSKPVSGSDNVSMGGAISDKPSNVGDNRSNYGTVPVPVTNTPQNISSTSSEYNTYKSGTSMPAPMINPMVQFHRDNVRLHQDNETLARSRDGMSDIQRKVNPPMSAGVTDFKSFKLGNSVRLEPIGSTSFDNTLNASRPSSSYTESYGSGLQQTSPSAIGQYSLSNNSSEAKMLTDLDAANDNSTVEGIGSFKNFLRSDDSSSEYKLSSSVSLNPVKTTTGHDSRSSTSAGGIEDLDNYKRSTSGFRLGSGVSLDIVKPKPSQDVDEYSKQSHDSLKHHTMMDHTDDYDDDVDPETIAARIANSIAGERQSQVTPVVESDVKKECDDEATTEDDGEYEHFEKEQENSANLQQQEQQMHHQPPPVAEEEDDEEEEEEETAPDENEPEDDESLNLLGKIKMEVDSDSEVVKIKEEQMDPDDEDGAIADDENEDKKSSKRKSVESDEDSTGKDKDNIKKKKTGEESDSDSDSDKKDMNALDRKSANFRRNIREVMDESQLDQATLNAQRQEMERLRRVQEQHRIIREVQKQIQMNKQNSKTETRVISLLQGNTSLLKTNSSASHATSPSSSGSQSPNTVVVKLSSGSGAPQIVNKKVLEMLRSQKSAESSAANTSSKVSNLARSILNKPHMMTPSVSIAPVKPKSPSQADSPAREDQMAAIRKVTGKAKGKDVVTISSSSSSDEDDCILISEPSGGEEEDEEEDPTNSGMHTNDTYNVPDEQGRVLVNVGHPDNEPDVFLAPQIARIIKPHQIGGVRFLFDNVVESLERFKTSSGFGCILAHSMGLGKTLQVVSFCDVFLRHTEARTVLCIMPINTLQNWLAEFNMWIPVEPSSSPLAAHGEVRPRNFPIFVLNDLQKTITARSKVVAEWSKQGGVLLIGYELYRQLSLKRPKKVRRGKKKFDPDDDFDNSKNKPLLEEMHVALVKPGPDLIICDEGHRIKNSHASISQALKQIRSKRRVVLTGYPLQNNLLEYWCMVDFVRPNYLGTKTEFSNMFERPIQNGQCIDSTPQDIRLMRYRAHVLHSLLEGFVQRRSHSVLTHTLPQKEEYVLLIRMTPFQRKLYDTFMNEVVRTKAVPNPLKAFAVCCKIWNHPDVLYQFLKKRANLGEAVDLDLDETAPIVPCPAPNMPGGIILPSLPGSLPPPAAKPPPPATKRGRGRSPKNPNAPAKRERKKPQTAAQANKTPAVAAVIPNATSSNTGSAEPNSNQGQIPIGNQGDGCGPDSMNQPPTGDASGNNQSYNQQYNNSNQFNQYQNQQQPPYPNIGEQSSDYNQGNYGSQPPPNEFQNQFQPNYPNQNNSFNNSDNFYQNYGGYYPQNPQDGGNTNYNNPGYWNNSYYNNNDNQNNFFEGGQFNETGNNGQQQWNQDNFQQGSATNYNQGFGNSAGSQGYGSGSPPNQNLNATATSGALNQQMQQDQQSGSYSDIQKIDQLSQQRSQGNMQQGMYGGVQNDRSNMLGTGHDQNLMDRSQDMGNSNANMMGSGSQSSQNQGMINSGQSMSNNQSFMGNNQLTPNQPSNNMMPPPASNMQGNLKPMQNSSNMPGPQHQNLQNPPSGQSMMQSHSQGSSNMNMMGPGSNTNLPGMMTGAPNHPQSGMMGNNKISQNMGMMGLQNVSNTGMMGINQQNMSGSSGSGDGMMSNQSDANSRMGNSSHSMLQPLGGQSSFGCNMQSQNSGIGNQPNQIIQNIGGDVNPNQSNMGSLHHTLPGNDQNFQGQQNMMGGSQGMNQNNMMSNLMQNQANTMSGPMHNQGLMQQGMMGNQQRNQSNQSQGNQGAGNPNIISEGGNNDLIPPPNLQQQNNQHPMMAGRPGPGLPGGGQNQVPPPQQIPSNSMISHQQPSYDNQNFMGNMQLHNQGLTGSLQDIGNSSQNMMMHNQQVQNHPGSSNQQQNPSGMDNNFHKPSQDQQSSDGGIYHSSYSMPSSTFHPPSQPDSHSQMGPMTGYSTQSSHQQQQSQHDKLIDDLFNNPSNDLGVGNQDASQSNPDNSSMMGISPIKNTGNNMSGGMLNIQQKTVNQQQFQPLQPFNQSYNDQPQHGYDSNLSGNVSNVSNTNLNQNQSSFNQSDMLDNYQTLGTAPSSATSTGQNFRLGANKDQSNQYHDQQQLNNYQNQQFDNSGGSFSGTPQGGFENLMQNTSNFSDQQQSNYMTNMFGASSDNNSIPSTNQSQQQNSGTSISDNTQMQSGFSSDKTFDSSVKDEQKTFDSGSFGQKQWTGDSKNVKDEASDLKTDNGFNAAAMDEKEMKSCGNQTDEKSDVKAETMVKDTTYTFGEMKEVGGAMKDAASGCDDKDEAKPDVAAVPALTKSGKEDPGIPYDWAERLLKGYVPGDIEASAKMAILFCILEESIYLGDRILVFSQSLFTLNLIEEFLQKTNLPNRTERWARNWNYYRLDGSTSALEREKLINEFNSNPNIHLFLVSTRAGSLGINLVGANRVIVFDASWNPCHDTQAVCRVYRYGQKKPCFVYRLVMDHCLEKKIYDRQINKQGMSDRVVDECNPDAHLSIKEVTNLCWDSEETESKPVENITNMKDKYIDVVMQKMLDKHGDTLSKEPFQHESLLVDRKDKKLSQAEKRLAKRSYELEKQANINSRPVYGYSGAGNQQGLQIRPTFRAIRGEGVAGVVNKPMASVRPMQSELSSQLVRDAGRPRSWIPAEVWQKQGMSAQEMTLPLDVVIPTNSPDRSSIVLKAGQKVMVLKSPKGIYMQLENGKIIAIRTAIKVGNKGEKKTDKREFTFEGKKEMAVQPNRQRVQNLPMMRNNISIIPRGGGATGITSRGGLAGNRPLARMLGQNSNRPWGTPKQPIATTKPYFGETPPVTVTVTKKKVDASVSSILRTQAKVERTPPAEESKDKMSDDNAGESIADEFGSKDKQPQRSLSSGSGASSETSQQDANISVADIPSSMMHKHHHGSGEREQMRTTEEELLHDVDDEDFDDEDDDDDDMDHHHSHHHQHHAHRMHTSPTKSMSHQSHQHHAMSTDQAGNKKSSFSTNVGAGQGMSSSAASGSMSMGSSGGAGAHSHQSSSGNTLMSNTGASAGHQSSTVPNVGSHSKTSTTSSATSAAVGAAPAERDNRHHQMMPQQHHHHQQMPQHHAQQPISNPLPSSRPDDREFNVHSRYPSSSSSMSKSGSESVSHSSASNHPPLPMHLSSSITVSPVASSASSISVPITSPSMPASNNSRPSSAVSINPVNTPSVPLNPPNPSVSINPVSVNPPSTYHHAPGQTSTQAGSTGRRYTSTEYTADALSKSSESSYHPALSHLKTISDHSISIFPVDTSKASTPSSTITSGSQYSGDYNYRQDYHSRPGPTSSRDYYQGFSQPPIGSYPSSTSSGYYPSSTVTSSSAAVQRKDSGKESTPGYPSSSNNYESSSSYLAPNPFTAAAVGSGYSSRSSYPQTTPPPSQPSTTQAGSYGTSSGASSSGTSDFSRMYSAFHRPEPSSFQPPTRPAAPPAVPPSHQYTSAPYNYNPYLMQPHPSYPPHHLPPSGPPGSQPPPQ